jgi:ApbE superfamily uncharacterized protein (UPF0280 family)
MNRERFRFFTSVFRESDLHIGVPHRDFRSGMAQHALQEQKRLYRLLYTYADQHPLFLTSLEPLPFPDGSGVTSRGSDLIAGDNVPCEDKDIPQPEIAEMLRCGIRTGTGPMSSVAGMFAEAVAKRLLDAFTPGELVVENGGDLFILNRNELVTMIHAGGSPISGKLGITLPGGTWGVCTSSGTLGHSFSRGKADAVTVVSRNTSMADAWATALGNRIKGEEDIDPLLDEVTGIPEVLACVVVFGEKIGIRGTFEVKLLS